MNNLREIKNYLMNHHTNGKQDNCKVDIDMLTKVVSISTSQCIFPGPNSKMDLKKKNNNDTFT